MKSHHKNSERFISKVFQDVFDKYDLMNDLMSLGIHRLWKKKFIYWLNPQKNTKLLDVASGTGDIAKLYLDKVNFPVDKLPIEKIPVTKMLDLKKRLDSLTGKVSVLKPWEQIPWEEVPENLNAVMPEEKIPW